MKSFWEEYGLIFVAICIVVVLLMVPLISPSSRGTSMSQHPEDIQSQSVIQQGQWMLLFGL